MRNKILDYLQLSLQGIGIASLGTLSIFVPKLETVLYGGLSFVFGLLIAMIKR